jgi:putative spermidine/putrescine transport system permease protein/spermidine/putrescine transport system permease protein
MSAATFKNGSWDKAKWLLLIVPLLYVVLTMGIPLLDIIRRSFVGPDGLTFQFYVKALTERLYVSVLFSTVKISFIVTVVCLLLAYPMAYLSVTAKSPKVRSLITAGVLIPYWVSMLVRIFAWQVILQNNGLVNQALLFLGFVKEPAKLLYTDLAVTISLVHILIPIMFLSLQNNMLQIDRNLLMASSIMGATKFYGFTHVFLPLSKPGILSGSIMVFVLALGFYIAPALLGGPDNMMLSNLIETSMTNFNWGLAAALSVELLVLVYLIIALTFKLTGNIFVKQP